MASEIPNRPLEIGTTRMQSSFTLYESSPEEVSLIISKLNPKKAAIADCIPTKFLKIANNISAHYLSLLFNICANTGVYPNILKIAQVFPIHKKGSKLECSNYRPISLLSPINKVFEKLLYSRLYLLLYFLFYSIFC